MKHNGHKTAIARTRLSGPMKWLDDGGLLEGRVLDYGCGRGFDADTLLIQGYDPHYRPVVPAGPFDVITCNYVLNVIPEEQERADVLAHIRSLLAPGGVAYITVRNDVRNLNGWTAAGTWQGLVALELPMVRKTSAFITYKMEG